MSFSKKEIVSEKDSKKLAESKRLYEENKASLENEVARVKSLVADLKFGATVLESDYRNIFSQFSKLVFFRFWT